MPQLRALRLAVALAVPSLGLLPGGCVELEPTAARPADAGAESGPPSDSGPGADVAYVVGDCARPCLEGREPGIQPFLDVGSCLQGAFDGPCREACTEGAVGEETPACGQPGIVSFSRVCNACLKDSCCDTFRRCLESADCVQIGLCANPCDEARFEPRPRAPDRAAVP